MLFVVVTLEIDEAWGLAVGLAVFDKRVPQLFLPTHPPGGQKNWNIETPVFSFHSLFKIFL